jgi:hypothetical protein
MGPLGTPKYPPPERPLSSPDPPRCLPPPNPPGRRAPAATTRAPDTPLDAIALHPPPTGCWWVGGTPWGAAGRPGGHKPDFQTHLHTPPQTD